MSDPLTSAVLSLFQISARTTTQCPPTNFNIPGTGTQTCTAGPGGRNRFNFNFGSGTQSNTAGTSTKGASGSP